MRPIMEEFITRTQAVSAISDLSMITLKGERLPYWNEVYRAIQSVPTAWIPVSKFEPEEGEYLVTYAVSDGYKTEYCIDVMYYGKPVCPKKDHECFYTVDSEYGEVERDDVIAWMPLIEPYKGEGE